jgi:gliding motility-associated-like protein
VNGKTYCYKVKATGTYGTAGITDPLINYSQEACGIPTDNEAPCSPILDVQVDCDNSQTILTWQNPNQACTDDVEKYLVYYRPPQATVAVLLDSTDQLTYTNKNNSTLAGCYAVVAVDSSGNRSAASDSVCISSIICGQYRLPNIFTPNGDQKNDFLIPFPYSGVESIDLQIFNRWGNLVFTSTDPDINWDGTMEGTGQNVSDGVYYYICDVYEISETGAVKRTIKGSVMIIR